MAVGIGRPVGGLARTRALLQISIIAVGRAKNTPEEAVVEDYRRRLGAMGRKLGLDGLTIVEVEDRKEGPGRKEREASLITARLPAGAVLVALDEHGQDISSAKLADRLKSNLEAGTRHLVFVIGGADGLSEDVLALAKLKIAFGGATWPHLLIRAMLAEQLYRAVTILSNHPYHRA